jgi:hypothetical protein
MNLQESIRKILKEETDGMKDIMFDMFDENTKGSEIYEYDNSLWLIIPDAKVWIFEIQDDLTLWYNLPFFEKIYKYVSLDAIDNQNYITKWVEDILKKRVRNTVSAPFRGNHHVEDIIKKGVKNTEWANAYDSDDVDNILKKGIKNTLPDAIYKAYQVQDIIKKGKKG